MNPQRTTTPHRSRNRRDVLLVTVASGIWTLVPRLSVAAEYLSPVPGSTMVSTTNNIVIRDGRRIDARSLGGATPVVVVGSESGIHPGRLILSDDEKTLVFYPADPFAPGERVDVRLEPGLRTESRIGLPPLHFDFTTTTLSAERAAGLRRPDVADECFATSPTSKRISMNASIIRPNPMVAGLPADYPPITLLTSDHPDPGAVFMTPFDRAVPGDGRLLIVDNYGMPLFYQQRSGESRFDLKVQNGLLTYLVYFKAFVLDSMYAKVDSFETGNGYRTDIHDFQWLPNHHSLLMAYDPQPVRMDLVVPGGNPNAIVTGLIVQELDASKNVIFQWRSWDHFDILDASVSGLVNMTSAAIDYVHGNAIELDQDGNLLISCRHMNEITKIDRSTGDIIWRMGLHALNNQFTFVNDARGFSHQHDIRRLPNGDITLFDNGNFLDPQYSRGVEYRLDEPNRRATLVWKYQGGNPPIWGGFMGNVQKRPDGGAMIGWGGTDVPPQLTEIHPDATKAFELALPALWHTYRAFRFPWRSNSIVTNKQDLDFGRVVVGGTRAIPMSVRNNSAQSLTITDLVTTDSLFASPTPVPFVIPPGQSAAFSVAFSPVASGQFSANLYLRSVDAHQLVAQVVALSGSTDISSAVSGDATLRTMLYQPSASAGGPVEVRFAIGEPTASARVEIFDVRGMRIRLLDRSPREPGVYALNWDRRDDKGRAVSRGVYFVRLTADGRHSSKKLTLAY